MQKLYNLMTGDLVFFALCLATGKMIAIVSDNWDTFVLLRQYL